MGNGRESGRTTHCGPVEHQVIREIAAEQGARSAVCTHFADGGRGAVELAEAVAVFPGAVWAEGGQLIGYGGRMLTAFGVIALTFMMAMYALEQRHRHFVLAFAVGCALSSSYGFLSRAWPFGVVEGIWTVVAIRRWAAMPSDLQAAGSDEGRYPAASVTDLP